MLLRPDYERLAPLFAYPDDGYRGELAEARVAIEARHPEAARRLGAFAELLPPEDPAHPERALNALQEIFTRSFSVQSITTLDVGYVVFGDDYKRAELLVNLNREQRAVGNECGAELPDHLPNVLRLLARWEDAELVEELVQEILHPALDRMLEEFDPERMRAKRALYEKHHKTVIESAVLRATMYRHLLGALRAALVRDFPVAREAPPAASGAFLRSIRRELEIAARGAGHRPTSRLR